MRIAHAHALGFLRRDALFSYVDVVEIRQCVGCDAELDWKKLDANLCLDCLLGVLADCLIASGYARAAARETGWQVLQLCERHPEPSDRPAPSLGSALTNRLGFIRRDATFS